MMADALLQCFDRTWELLARSRCRGEYRREASLNLCHELGPG